MTGDDNLLQNNNDSKENTKIDTEMDKNNNEEIKISETIPIRKMINSIKIYCVKKCWNENKFVIASHPLTTFLFYIVSLYVISTDSHEPEEIINTIIKSGAICSLIMIILHRDAHCYFFAHGVSRFNAFDETTQTKFTLLYMLYNFIGYLLTFVSCLSLIVACSSSVNSYRICLMSFISVKTVYSYYFQPI